MISFVRREMGLMVKRGNLLKIASLKDIVERKARFVNRDHDLARACCSTSYWRCTESTRPKSRRAADGVYPRRRRCLCRKRHGGRSFGVEAAARQFGLDFIRLLTEDYFFVCKRTFLETEPMRRVLDIMKGREFHEAVVTLPGYIASSTGTVRTVKEFLKSMGSNAS